MCGIAGFWKPELEPGAGEAYLTAMLDRIVHRGPDAEGRHHAEAVGSHLGMRRLSVIDLAGGGQPMWNETRDVAVVFNGEIYNYRQLQQELRSRGHVLETASDTEVLVHLYEEDGESMTSRLRGMFAFCILDLKARRLFLARDAFGQKPLYYVHGPGVFAFASEVKALLALPFVPREVDEERFLDYACWFSLPSPFTHFRGIRKLGAAESVVVALDSGAMDLPRRYWRMGFGAGLRFQTLGDAGDAVHEALNESMALHVHADVPVGVLLSGGLDSFAVAAHARHAHGRPLASFTAGFAGQLSEAAEARASAARLGTAHHEIELGPDDLLESMDAVAWHLDEPIGDPACFAVRAICRRARDHVKVLLGGEGSDELFAGYGPRYAGILRTIRRSSLIRYCRGLLPVTNAAFPESRWRRLGLRAHQPPLQELVALRREGLPGHPLQPLALTPPQLEDVRRREQAWAGHLAFDHAEGLDLVQLFDLSWQLPESLLMKADKMSMSASIELRCPFLDPALAAVAARCSPRQRLDLWQGVGKLPLREGVRRHHGGASVLPKRGFVLPLGEWLRGPLRRPAEDDLFHGPAGRVRAFLDAALLRQAWEAFQNGAPLAQTFYALWLYERWARQMNSR